MNIEVGIIETLLVALVILFVGYFCNNKIAFLRNNNIPEPVVGGIVFSILAGIAHFAFDFHMQFDMSFKNPLMTLFFTTVGLGASFSLLIKGGPKVVLFLGVATAYLLVQNAVGVSVAMASGLEPLMGLIGGSVTLSGGHGNGATYSDLFIQEYGMPGSVFELAMAAATLGLVLGGLVGGPVSKRLIKKYNLKADEFHEELDDTVTFNPEDHDLVTPKKMMETLFIILLCMAVGQVAQHDGKGVLKDIARGRIPDAVIDRPKGYFPMPALKFVRGDFYQFMADTLNSQRSRERGLFDRAYLDKLLAEPEQHFTRLNGSKLWHSALLEYWLQQHVDA